LRADRREAGVDRLGLRIGVQLVVGDLDRRDPAALAVCDQVDRAIGADGDLTINL
jgi:hypothetical protein